MNALQERIDRLYRAMEAQHLLYPTLEPKLHDPWQIDLISPVPGWWNNYRVLYFSMLRVTLAVEGKAEHRFPAETVLNMAEWILQRQELPNLWICGSHSPLSPRYPYPGSDVDFVFFIPLEDFFAHPKHWMALTQHVQLELMPQCSKIFGIDVECGVLAEEFRPFPFMLDAAELTVPDAHKQWCLSLEEVVTILEQRWEHFIMNKDEISSYNQRIINTMFELLGNDRVVQIVAEARWEDITCPPFSQRHGETKVSSSIGK